MRPIQAGDLVMVVKPTLCCGAAHSIGIVFIVNRVQEKVDGFCRRCNADTTEPMAICYDDSGAEVSRIIRIDPPADLEESERELEVAL